MLHHETSPVRARAGTTHPFRRRGIPARAARSPRNTPSIPRRSVSTGVAPRRRSDLVVSARALSRVREIRTHGLKGGPALSQMTHIKRKDRIYQ